MIDATQHRREAERLLSDASFVDGYGHPVRRDGQLMMPGEHTALIGRGLLHAVLAVAAELIDEDPAEQLLDDARRAPVLRMPMRSDTPNTATAPADAPARADRTGPTT